MGLGERHSQSRSRKRSESRCVETFRQRKQDSNSPKVGMPGDGIEPPTRGFSVRALEFHNLLIFSKLLKQSYLAFSDFQRFSTFWQTLEGFSHTDSHTELLSLACPLL